jgi:hypothetical protein
MQKNLQAISIDLEKPVGLDTEKISSKLERVAKRFCPKMR